MENDPDSNNPVPNSPKDSRKFHHPRGSFKTQPSTLRDALNKKRHDPNKPPPEPKYNFLADPLRDNNADLEPTDPENEPKGEQRPERGRGRSRSFHNQHFENRRGSGRGRSSGRPFEAQRGGRKPQFNNRADDEEWRDERSKIDQERISRQRSDDGGWTREWDAGKEEIPTSSTRFYASNRYPRNYNQNHQQSRTYANNPSTSTHQEPLPHSDQSSHKPYNRSSRGYNPNYYRGRRGRNYSPRLNPVNITVQFSAETGERKCTLETIKIPPKKRNQKTAKPAPKEENVAKSMQEDEDWGDENKEDENWDEPEEMKSIEKSEDSEECVGDLEEKLENLNLKLDEILDKIEPQNDEK